MIHWEVSVLVESSSMYVPLVDYQLYVQELIQLEHP